MGQPHIPPTPIGTSLAGRTVIITGGNSGIGFETARQFLILQASRVIITVRSKSKGEEAVSTLRNDPEVKKVNPAAIIQVFELELDNYESGLKFSQQVKAEVKELDILVCNGGVNIMYYETSKSGHEYVMQVNCYTHFLICLELLPLLQATAAVRGIPSHVTFVGSGNQTLHTLEKRPVRASETVLGHFDDLASYARFNRYGDSKLVANSWIRSLASHVGSSEVIANNFCPGLVDTRFDAELPLWMKPIIFVFRKAWARTVEEGSRLVVYAACLAGPETHGKFLMHNKINPGAPFLDGPAGKAFSEKLWTEMLAEVNNIDPELGIVTKL